MTFDTVAVREWAGVPMPADDSRAAALWAELRENVIAACDRIDEIEGAGEFSVKVRDAA